MWSLTETADLSKFIAGLLEELCITYTFINSHSQVTQIDNKVESTNRANPRGHMFYLDLHKENLVNFVNIIHVKS